MLSVDNQEVAHPLLLSCNLLCVKHSHGRSPAIFPLQPYHWELMFPSMLCWSTNHTVSSNTPVKEQDVNAGRWERAGREVTKQRSSCGEGSCLEQRLEKMRARRVLQTSTHAFWNHLALAVCKLCAKLFWGACGFLYLSSWVCTQYMAVWCILLQIWAKPHWSTQAKEFWTH